MINAWALSVQNVRPHMLCLTHFSLDSTQTHVRPLSDFQFGFVGLEYLAYATSDAYELSVAMSAGVNHL